MNSNPMAVITGASSGIGKAMAEEMAKRGFSLLLIARRENLLKEIKKDLEQRYQIKVDYKSYDLSQPENYKKLAEDIKSQKIDYFFNNAGISYFDNLVAQDPERVDQMVNLNIGATTYLTNAVCKQMAAMGGGVIVNTGSKVSLFEYAPCHAVYGAAKKYIYDFSRAVNYENEKLNNRVRVIALNPGMIKTDLQKKSMPNQSMQYHPTSIAQDPGEFVQEVLDMILAGKNVINHGPMPFSTRLLRLLPAKTAAKISYDTMQKFMGAKK